VSLDRPAVLKFSQLFGTFGGSEIKGKLSVALGSPVLLDGAIEADRLDVQAAIATVFGKSLQQMRKSDGGGDTWSLEPFAVNTSTLSGTIDLKIARAVLSEKLFVKQLQGMLQFGASKVALEILDSELARGRLVGQLSFYSSIEGLSALSYLELIGATAAELIPADGQPPVTGILSLKATIEGAGLSPAAFFGSLKGSGTITVEEAEFSGLNPRVFEALTRAVDLGIQSDTKQIREFVGALLFNGELKVNMAQSAITFVGGQARLVAPRVEANGADLAVTATLNLADAGLDATLALSGAATAGVAGRPAVSVTLKGPLTAPKHTINADSLAGWLALRSVEQQSKRLEIIEMTRRAASGQAPSVLSAVPAASSAEDNDANPTTQTVTDANPAQTQVPTDANSTQKQTPAQTNVESNPITADTSNPITADTTGGILGAIQAPPPLPPAITVETPVSIAPPTGTASTRTAPVRGAERFRTPTRAERAR
jgi:large subunit ribosomal protein L24